MRIETNVYTIKKTGIYHVPVMIEILRYNSKNKLHSVNCKPAITLISIDDTDNKYFKNNRFQFDPCNINKYGHIEEMSCSFYNKDELLYTTIFHERFNNYSSNESNVLCGYKDTSDKIRYYIQLDNEKKVYNEQGEEINEEFKMREELRQNYDEDDLNLDSFGISDNEDDIFSMKVK